MELHAAPLAAARPLALDAPTLVHAFQHTAAQRPDEIALRNPGDAVTLTWREYAGRVERIAAGLAALGVERGDAVALMLLNRPEFHLVDSAVLHLGATPFSVYNTSTSEQTAYQFANAGNRVVVTERHFLSTVLDARRLVPAVDEVVLDRRLRGRHPPPRPGRGDGCEQLPLHRDVAGGAPLGPRNDHLHLGHHRPAQGRRADARQRDGAVRGERGALPADRGRAGDVLPAERARGRPLDVPLVGVAHPRLHGHLDRRHADRDPDAPRPAADHVGRRAADLGEAAAHAHEPGRRRPGGAGRGGPGRAAGATRLRPRRTARRRCGADADRRAALLRRARAADRRGLGDVRDRRGGHGQPVPAPSASAPVGPRCRASSSGSPATPSCSCADRS